MMKNYSVKKAEPVSDLEHMMQRDSKPEHGEIVIAWNDEGKRCQVQIDNGRANIWRYGMTANVFCEVDDISKWRGCTGFDF